MPSSGNQSALFVELIDAKTRKNCVGRQPEEHVHGIFVSDDALIRPVGGVGQFARHAKNCTGRSHSLPTLEGYTLFLGAVALMHRTQFTDFDRAAAMLST